MLIQALFIYWRDQQSVKQTQAMSFIMLSVTGKFLRSLAMFPARIWSHWTFVSFWKETEIYIKAL